MEKKTKHLKFDRLSSWKYLLLIAPSIIFFLIGFWKNGLESNLFMAIGFLCLALFVIRPFLYQQYVGWNKKGMQLKFSYWGMKSIPFKTIQGISVEEDVMTLTRLGGTVNEYDISEIAADDIHKLERIIIRHSNL